MHTKLTLMDHKANDWQKHALMDVRRFSDVVLLLQPHNARQRSDLFDRSLNNELDFDCRALDDAILDAPRKLGGFKVALCGRATRDYHAIALSFAQQLKVLVAWSDERTQAMTAFIARECVGTEYDIVCDDCEPDGFTFRRLTPKLTRNVVDNIVADVLWLQPHSATRRSELFDQSLNNGLDFDLCAVDDAILNAVRELGERGIPLKHADLRFDLRRYYPPIVPTLMCRIADRNVTAPDLYFDEIANAIWNAVLDDFKSETGQSP